MTPESPQDWSKHIEDKWKPHTNFPQGRCSLTPLCVPMRYILLSLCWIHYNIASALSLGFLAARPVGSYLAPGSGIEPSHLAWAGSCAHYYTSAHSAPLALEGQVFTTGPRWTSLPMRCYLPLISPSDLASPVFHVSPQALPWVWCIIGALAAVRL